MEKRYQIFISSTFSDLKEERNKVMQTIMSLDCIPAGMELFPAMDEEQFEFIKRIIDDCDYYILIIGARYGSMDDYGVSYTEKEYDYAVSKGIPVLAFLHKDISSIPNSKTDLDKNLQKKLEKFRKKVEKGRLVQYWDNADNLNAKVAVSLPKTIKMFPRIGWVKANLMANSESLQEINELRKENEVLRAYKAKHEKDTKNIFDIADWDEEFCAHFTSMRTDLKVSVLQFSYSWLEWFKMIALELDNCNRIADEAQIVVDYIVSSRENIDESFIIDDNDFATIGYQFISHGVISKGSIKPRNDDFFSEIWTLTEKGEKLLAHIMCVKTKKQ